MSLSLADLACLVEGELAGDATLILHGAATLELAQPGDVTFVDAAERAHKLATSRASAAIVPRDFPAVDLPCVRVADALGAFAAIVARFRPPRVQPRSGVCPGARVSPSAKLADDVDVHAGATIGDDVELGPGCTIHPGACIQAGCKLGAGVTVFPNAVLYEGTVVGPRCIIHANAVLGAFGFGYKLVEGRHRLSAQMGWVELGADVEVGACSTIDRGAFGPTIVGEGTKIDNMVMVAHNCRIGRHNLLCSQAGIAGSTTTGEYVVLAGQAGVRDHVHIGDRAVVGAKAGVPSDVPAGTMVFGSPARPEREQKLIMASTHKLPEMRRQLKDLIAKVAALEERLGGDRKSAA